MEQYFVTGMSCADCQALESVPGVFGAETDHLAEKTQYKRNK